MLQWVLLAAMFVGFLFAVRTDLQKRKVERAFGVPIEGAAVLVEASVPEWERHPTRVKVWAEGCSLKLYFRRVTPAEQRLFTIDARQSMSYEVIAKHQENRSAWGAVIGGGVGSVFGTTPEVDVVLGAIVGFLVGTQIPHQLLEVEVAGYSHDQYLTFRLKGSQSAYEMMVRQIEAARMAGASTT